MAHVNVETYIVQNAMKLYMYYLEQGNKHFISYQSNKMAKTKLSWWERFKGMSLIEKHRQTNDYFSTINNMYNEKLLEDYTFNALYWTVTNEQKLIDLVNICKANQKTLQLDGWEYNFIHYFAEPEYQAMLEERENVH